MSRRSHRIFSILAAVVIAGCGKSRVARDDEGSEGSGAASGMGGHAGESSAGVAGTAGDGATTGGSSSGRGGVGGTEGGAAGNAGAGGGQGPDDCVPEPNDSNSVTDYVRTQTLAELRGGAGLAIDRDGSAHVAVAMHGQLRYLVDGDPKYVFVTDVHPTSEVRLALDSNGEPRILFGGFGAPVQLAVRSEGSWSVRPLASDGVPVGIFVAPNGETVLGYLDYPMGQTLHLASGFGVELRFEATLDAYNAALALGPSGELHVISERASGGIEYSHVLFEVNRVATETVPLTLAYFQFSHQALAVDPSGTPGFALLIDGVLVYLVRDPEWRRIITPGPLYPEPPLVVFDEASFAHLLLSGGGSHLSLLSQGPDGFTETETTSIGPPRAFVLDPYGVTHAVVETYDDMTVGERAYVTNRDIVPDSIDQNCDGVDGFDRDGDGHASVLTGGGDCDDHDDRVNPDVDDFHGDGRDSDCDGFGHCPVGLPGPPFVEVPYGNRGFCMDATEVTNADYAAFLGSGETPPGRVSPLCLDDESFEPAPLGAPAAMDRTCPGFLPDAEIPLTCIDWCDAVAYCAWAGKRLCGASFGEPITDPAESVWRIACDSGLMGIGDYGAVWEWQDGCTDSTRETAASDMCPAYGGRFTTAPAPDRCNESISVMRGDVSDIVGFRCCDL